MHTQTSMRMPVCTHAHPHVHTCITHVCIHTCVYQDMKLQQFLSYQSLSTLQTGTSL